MASNTKIEWTEATWNPIVGCSVVSPGCTNCYAMKMAARIERMAAGAGKWTHYNGTTQASKAGPVWTGRLTLAPDEILTAPLRWKRPRRIFVNSMSDLFHEAVPDEWIDRVFAVMALAPQHTFQVLTKRSGRMREYMNGIQSKIPFLGRMPLERIHLEAAAHMEGDGGFMDVLKDRGNVYSLYLDAPWPLPNVWLGVSTEDQRRADERVPDLLATQAAVRFVSAEPLLGPIDFSRIEPRGSEGELDSLRALKWQELWDTCWSPEVTKVSPDEALESFLDWYNLSEFPSGLAHPALDWIIVGGESGPGARPMHPDWARSIRDQCAAARVPFFFKQWGEWCPATSDFGVSGHRMPDTGEKFTWIGWDGQTQNPSCDRLSMPIMAIAQMGKRRAGRLLDGREHNDMPKARAND